MPVVRSRFGSASNPRDTGNVVMHRLDQIDDAGDPRDGQPVDATKIGSDARDFRVHAQAIPGCEVIEMACAVTLVSDGPRARWPASLIASAMVRT